MKMQKEGTAEIIEGLQKQHSNKFNFLIIIFSVIGIIIFFTLLISAYFYFKTPEKTLGLGANIESSLLSEDGKISYLKLAGGSLDKNILPIEIKSGKIEYRTLKLFMKKFKVDKGIILTYDTKEEINGIEVIPFYEFLLKKVN